MRYAHPWGIGVGEESFRRVYPSFAVSGTETVMHAHRLFGQIGVELGWGGAVLLAVTFLLILLESVRRCGGEDARDRGEILALLACLLGGLVMGLFDYVWYHYGVFWLFWTLCACLCALARNEEEKHEKGK